jgi:hypothetical protein
VLSPALALVSPNSATIYWYISRGAGFTVFILLTVAVSLGILLSLKWRTDAWPRFITVELHPFVQLVAGVFLLIHIISVLLDSFIRFSLAGILIPFVSTYRPVWLSFGIVATYLGVALAISSYLKKFIGYRVWRTMHYGGFVVWVFALIHGVTTGSDTRAPWATAIYAGSALLVAGLLAVRFGGLPIPLGQPPRWRPRVVLGLAVSLVAAGFLTAIGPDARGWAARARSLHLPGESASTIAVAQIVLPRTFQGSISGTAQLDQNSPQLQGGTALLNMHLTTSGNLTLSYGLLLAQAAGGAQFVRGDFSATPRSLAWNCSGSVTFRAPDTLDGTCTLPNRTIEIVSRFRLDNSGGVTGEVSGMPAAGANGRADSEGSADTNDSGAGTST